MGAILIILLGLSAFLISIAAQQPAAQPVPSLGPISIDKDMNRREEGAKRCGLHSTADIDVATGHLKGCIPHSTGR